MSVRFQTRAPLIAVTLVCAVWLCGCKSTPASAPDTTDPPDVLADVAPEMDTELDTGPAEVDVEVQPDTAPDASAVGATAWGPISGECGALAEALGTPGPALLMTTWTFDEAVFDPSPLSTLPELRFSGDNAGGSSRCSEAMSMELLIACDGATIDLLETDITYDVAGSLMDYAATVDGVPVGVSVTRAYLGPFVTEYTVDDATTLLTDKLNDALESTANVSAADAWERQILHVWTLHGDWADIVAQAWVALPAEVVADTIVLVTVEDGSETIVPDTCDE